MTRGTWARWARAFAILVLFALSWTVTSAGDLLRLTDGPADIYEHQSAGSRVVATAQAGDTLLVLVQDGEWVRVQLPSSPNAVLQAGWISRAVLARVTKKGGSTKATRASTSEGNTPPTPVGLPPAPAGLPMRRGSVVGDWIQPRGLRASVGVNYESAQVSQSVATLHDRLAGGGATVTAGLAVLDPRILTLDFTGDFQASRATTRASAASSANGSGLQSYRLALGVLSGRSAPLQLYVDRVSTSSTLQASGSASDPLRRTRGVRRGAGFTWDVETTPLLPHIQLSASTTHQLDERNYLFGYGSTNDERRAELRASRDYRRVRYTLDFNHGTYAYDVPGAGVRTDTGNDLLLATARLVPVDRLALDFNARASQFRFGAGADRSSVTGAGVDGSARYQLSRRLAASARYGFSNNAAEAAISGKLSPGAPGAVPIVTTSQLTTRTLFQDGDVRLEYATRPFTAAAIAKATSYGVPPSQSETLATIATGGLTLHAQHEWRGVLLTGGADASGGTARSSVRRSQPYREWGVEAGIGRDVARTVRFGATIADRRIARLAFFPVSLDARNATVRFETLRPGFARLRASMTRFDTLRDVISLDGRDIHTGYTFGVAGAWYDVAFDLNQADTRSMLLAPGVLGARPDVAMLVLSRPELFRNLLASSDRSRLLALQLHPIPGLQLQARVRRQDQSYTGLLGYDLRGAQASASWQVRELQLEIGWEYLDSATSFGSVRDRRLYVRVRRDVIFF